MMNRNPPIKNLRPRKKGDPKVPGSGIQKGGKMLKRKLTAEFIEEVLANNADRFNYELSKLKGEKYIKVMLILMEFAIPKLSRREMIGNENSPVQLIVGLPGKAPEIEDAKIVSDAVNNQTQQ